MAATTPKSSHLELLPPLFKKLPVTIDPFKRPRTIGSEGARSRTPAKFKCGRPSTPANFQSPASGSTVGIHTMVDHYKTAAINTAHHQFRFGRSEPTKSTQEWRSRWVEDRRNAENLPSPLDCVSSLLDSVV